MTSMSGSSVRSTPSSVVIDLAGLRAADAQLGPREPGEIEGVHGMAELEQHVVGDVDDRADRPHAGRLKPRGVIHAGDGAREHTSATAAA